MTTAVRSDGANWNAVRVTTVVSDAPAALRRRINAFGARAAVRARPCVLAVALASSRRVTRNRRRASRTVLHIEAPADTVRVADIPGDAASAIVRLQVQRRASLALRAGPAIAALAHAPSRWRPGHGNGTAVARDRDVACGNAVGVAGVPDGARTAVCGQVVANRARLTRGPTPAIAARTRARPLCSSRHSRRVAGAIALVGARALADGIAFIARRAGSAIGVRVVAHGTLRARWAGPVAAACANAAERLRAGPVASVAAAVRKCALVGDAVRERADVVGAVAIVAIFGH